MNTHSFTDHHRANRQGKKIMRDDCKLQRRFHNRVSSGFFLSNIFSSAFLSFPFFVLASLFFVPIFFRLRIISSRISSFRHFASMCFIVIPFLRLCIFPSDQPFVCAYFVWSFFRRTHYFVCALILSCRFSHYLNFVSLFFRLTFFRSCSLQNQVYDSTWSPQGLGCKILSSDSDSDSDSDSVANQGLLNRVGPRWKNQGPARRIRASLDGSGPHRMNLGRRPRRTNQAPSLPVPDICKNLAHYETGHRKTNQGPAGRIRAPHVGSGARMTEGATVRIRARGTDQGPLDEPRPRKTK